MGEIIEGLRKEGHIRDSLYVPAARLLDDMRRAHGSSRLGSVMLMERVQGSVQPRCWPAGGGDPDAFARMNVVLCQLMGHERRTMAYMIRAREVPRGSLADQGRWLSGYEHSRAARAYMTGRICSLLESIAEVYPQAG